MRKLLFIFLFTGLNLAYSQNLIDKKGGIGVYFEGGYNKSDLKEISDFYSKSVNSYVAHDVPVKIQKLFPGNGIYGAGIYFNVEEELNFRIALHYADFRAASSYNDNTMNIDITGKAESYNIDLGVQKVIPVGFFLTPLAEVNMGFFICGSSFAEKITQAGVSEEDGIDFSSFGLYLQPAIGACYDVKPFRIYAKYGYKFLAIQEGKINDFDSPEIDMSGYFIMTGLGISFNSMWDF